MGKRGRFTPEEKVKALREIFEDGKSISAVAEGYDIHPNNIFTGVGNEVPAAVARRRGTYLRDQKA
jgi:transposase-like protein